MPRSQKQVTGLTDSWGRLNNRKLLDKACAHCGKTFRPRRPSNKYCSRPCAWVNNGKNNLTKNEGWWINPRGYIEGFIRVDGVKKKLKQHRWVMEQHLRRPLSASEDVHHINGVKTDNRIENLEVVTHGAHSTKTNNRRVYKRGYNLQLSDEERRARSKRMAEQRAKARAAVAKAQGAQTK